MPSKKILVVIALLLFYAKSYAQNFQNLFVEQGLSNSTTFAIAQDHKGLMWFSTKEGIDRYDGSGYKHYNLYPADKLTRYGLRRNKFHVDDKQRIWVNNFSDIFLYQHDLDRFDFVYNVANNNTIRDLFVKDDQHILLATDQGLIKYNYQTKKSNSFAELSQPIVGFYRYNNELLLIALKNDILFFNLKTEKISATQLSSSLRKEINQLSISSMCVDAAKNIFVGSTGQISTFKITDQSLKTNATLNSSISKVEVTKILPDQQQFIYFGTEGKGVYKIDAQLNIVKAYLTDQNNLASLPENEAIDVFIDKENRVWMAGHEISYLNTQQLKFNYYTHQINNPNSLVHNSIRSVVEDHSGKLWVGTNFGISILKPDRKNWDYINTHSQQRNMSSNKVTALAKGQHQDVVAGTYQSGIYQISASYEITHLSRETNFSPKNNVNKILVNGNDVWYGGAGGYLKRLDLGNGLTKTFAISNVLSIAKNQYGQIITGGHNGINIIDLNDGITTFNASTYKIGSIFCVMADTKNQIWLGSEGQGLIKFDIDQKKFKKYSTKDGLPSNLVYGILEDNDHNLWISTTKGLSCFDIKKQTFRNYSIADGLPIKEFAYGAYTKTAKGEMVFGGNHGLVIFNPKDIINSDFNTRLIFTDFKLFNKTADIGNENTPLAKAIDETEKIDLAYNQNAITFEFSSVNFTNNANLYRWKLDGLDSEWSPATAEHAANYTNLRPGNYTFKVQWANSGLVSEFAKNERVLQIRISPPIWATTWAYLLYLLIAIGMVYAVIKFYMVQLSENHAKDKIRFFINIVHDIRTPLSLIRSPLNIALKKNDFSENTQSILKTANHNASRLTSLIDQLLDFEKDDFKKIKLNRTSIHAEQTLDRICDDFIPLLEQRGIILTRNHQHQETLLRVDKDKFDKIIFNILSNAVKYTPKSGQIHITSSIINKNFQIDIRDSGVGIPSEQQKYIFKRYFRAKNVVNSNEVGFGIGLMVTRELVKLHQGEIWFESNLDQGTTFHVRFPMSEVEYQDQQSLLVPQSNASIINELPDETAQQQKKPKVLIAEDNDELRNLMADHLKQYYQIYHVNNGQQGLTTTSKIAPDVIVSDVMMPLMDGNEFCYEIKNNLKTSHIPFILLTALTTNEHKIEGYKIGADTYLEKPFDVDLLRSCIDNLLVGRKKLRERFANADAPVIDGLNELDKKFIEEVVKIVESNLSNSNFSIEELEKEIGMSHASLYRKFKGLLGKTPLEFIQHYRLKKSMELLVSGEHYVNEVAYLVGFSDPKYFSTVFKKFYGKNASDYLKEK